MTKGKYKQLKAGDAIGTNTTFVKFVPKKTRYTRGLLKCMCGNEYEADLTRVEFENLGCGCRHGANLKPKHGHTGKNFTSITYSSWKSAKSRCFNPKNIRYKDYGGKGVTMCDRWLGEHGFKNFLSDMGERPSKSLTLDRFPDKNGNYEPSNCRWATIEMQSRNLNRNVFFTFNGEKLCLSDWSKKMGIAKETLRIRYNEGWSMNDLLNPSIKHTSNRDDKHLCFTPPIKKLPILKYIA